MSKTSARNRARPMPVLVTGGAGYIGSHACKALKAQGFLPVVLDNLSTGRKTAVKWGPFVKGDTNDLALLLKTLRKYKPVAIMHFAALISVNESVAEPERYFDNNVKGSLTLLKAARMAGIRHFIFSSSAAVYGAAKVLPIPEGAPLAPINPYGETKRMTEQLLAAYHDAYGLNYIAFRYFNAAGADPEGETGSMQKEPLNLIPIVIDSVRRRKKLKVFGDDYATEDGTAIRDYIHVSDVAEAHVQGLHYLMDGGQSRAVNLGTGKGHSVLQVIRAMEEASGKRIPYQIAGRRKGDPAAVVADNRLAKKMLGWKPRHSSLETIASTAWHWALNSKGA